MKYYCPVSADLTYSLRYLKVGQDRGVRKSEWKKPTDTLQYCEFCERVFPAEKCVEGLDGWKNTELGRRVSKKLSSDDL
jgi:hypothetical protein